MAKPALFTLNFLFLLVFLLPHCSNQLQPSQYEALVRIKQLLKFPEELSSWSENQDFCNSEPTQILTLACYEDNITQLHVTGTYWFPHLSQDFSIAALFSNIAALPYLKVLSLVSIGLKGPLPSGIGELSSLEILNISSNSFNGSIPREISSMRNLQTLILDHNNFTGEVPDWLSSLPGLSVLSLKNNSFSGSLPDALSTMTALRALVLSGNNLSGQVPGLHNLTNLQVLDLENNNLGPQFPSLPTKLVSLVFRKNKFHSAVSDELSSCYQLKKLDISLNELVGLFSPSLLSLPSLTYLDIGGNKFTAKLSENISCNAELAFVNLSENRLTGELPDCLQSSSGSRVVLYNGNCLSGRYQDQHPLSFCHSEALAVGISPHKEDEKRGYDKAVLASSMVGGIVGATALLGLAFLFVKREFAKQHRHVNKDPHTRLIVDKISPANTLQLLKDARYISETMKLGALGIPLYRTFVLDELKEATNNFNALNLIGEGSYGQVYKGWLIDGTVVAIRSMKVKRRHSIHTYTHQLELVAKLRYCHLVSAIGHCFECCQDDSSVSRIFLVFEYVPNGTLRSFVSDGQPGQKFTWKQRIGAAVGVARGIQFLHTGIVPGVYSNRLKITDVLLDHDLHVKISKYNLPLLAETRRLDELEVSSRGPKQDFASMLGCEEKDDVYDFGVILLEIIVGRTIVSFSDVSVSRDILSVSLTADSIARRSIVDPAIHKECSDDSLKTLIELCIRCLSTVPSERPSVEDVLWNLLFAAQVQEMWHREASSNRDSPVHAPSVNLTV
ncbi:UNVERIFIED_CONTAM: putative inactive leucine-rich repeat receptor-like protein kinase [Sesamum latifolium]|uniref:Inactive leucine-rich repeat receptor-like protein kinase n=1 Tax=Sesamum latifolium TaxID=2727402 RepID=A0AAW2YEA6_9LAMI